MRALILILLCLSSWGSARAETPVPANELSSFLRQNKETHPRELYPRISQYLHQGTEDQKDEVIRYLWGFNDLPSDIQRDLAVTMLTLSPNGAAPIESGAYDTIPPPNSGHAGIVLSNQENVSDPEVRAAILKFLGHKLQGPVPFAYRWSESVDDKPEERFKLKRGISRLQANMQMAIAQGLLIQKSDRYGFSKEQAKPVLEKAFDYYSNDLIRLSSIEALIRNGWVDDAFVEKSAGWQPASPSSKMKYSVDLFKKAKEQRNEFPEWESYVLAQLTHPNAQVRSEAIDLLRSWGDLKSERALKRLKAMAPSLSGYPLNVATELLENMKLPQAQRPKVPARPLGRIPKPISRGFDNHPVFLTLMEDLFIEAQDFNLSPEQQRRLQEVREDLWNSEKPNRLEHLDAFSWGRTRLPEFETLDRSAVSAPLSQRVTRIETPGDVAKPHHLHSMPDFSQYLENRLGPNLVDQVREGHTNLTVWAGTLPSLLQHEKLNAADMMRLPSPYAEWGIEKYIDFRGEKPTVYFVIPPITEYAKHYDSMLKNIGSSQHRVALHEGDRDQYRRDSVAAVKSLYDSIPESAHPSIVSLGYDYAIPDLLKSRPEWELLEQKSITPDCQGCGVKGTLVKLRHKTLGGEPISMLLLSSDRSLWGEGSEFLLEGVLAHNPKLKEFWFFGSAGSPGLRNLYGVSVPDYFMNRDGTMQVDGNHFNFGHTANHPVRHLYGKDGEIWLNAYSNRKKRGFHRLHDVGADGLPLVDEITVATHTTHGQSYSPAEQTRLAISGLFTEQRTHTVDVETNLLAAAIARHNLKHPDRRVKFGAAHVVTDIPASNSHTFDSGKSLSAVDKVRKSNARAVALTVAFDALEQTLAHEKWVADRENSKLGISQSWSAHEMLSQYEVPGPVEKSHRGCRDSVAQIAHIADDYVPPRDLRILLNRR